MEATDFIKLQSNIDMLISSLIMEFSYFSLDQSNRIFVFTDAGNTT